MNRKILLASLWLAVGLLLSLASDGQAQEQASPVSGVTWQEGPSTANLGGQAEIRVPAGYVFVNGDDARVLLEAAGNQPSHEEVGLLAPAELDWFVVFEFSDVGYIKDEEKDDLDADALLKSIRAGNEQANEWRSERGFPTMAIVGWEQKPSYNDLTHNLEWAIQGKDEAGITINHNTRLLGRKGVMKVNLVAGSQGYSTVLPTYRENLGTFSFKAGHRYEEFTEGDKIAKYGLGALVVGAGAAAAAKAGVFKYLWKLIVVAGLAVLGFLKWLFGARTQVKTEA